MSTLTQARNILFEEGLVALLSRSTQHVYTKSKTAVSNQVARSIIWARDGQTNCAGVRLDLSGTDISPAILGDIYRGEYEKGEREMINTHLSPRTPAIELGGGLGVVSVQIDSILNTATQQVVVEPNSKVLPVLRRTKELNDADFTIEDRAYSATESEAEFYHAKRFWSSSAQSETESSEHISAVSLRDICDQFDLGSFTLVADIEGGEIDIVNELSFLEEHCALAIIELHSSKSEHETISEQIRNAREEFKNSKLDVVVEDDTKLVLQNPALDL